MKQGKLHLESSFRSRGNQVLNFQMFKNVMTFIKCLSVIHETHLMNNLGSKHSLVMKLGQFM